MIRPKNKTENLLISIIKIGEKIIEHTHRKPKEALEFKLTKSRETFHFNPPVEVEEKWMIGLIDLEAYNTIFKITEENNKFGL